MRDINPFLKNFYWAKRWITKICIELGKLSGSKIPLYTCNTNI